MGKSQQYYPESKEPETHLYVLYDSIYRQFCNRKSKSGCLVGGVGGEGWLKRSMREISRWKCSIFICIHLRSLNDAIILKIWAGFKNYFCWYIQTRRLSFREIKWALCCHAAERAVPPLGGPNSYIQVSLKQFPRAIIFTLLHFEVNEFPEAYLSGNELGFWECVSEHQKERGARVADPRRVWGLRAGEPAPAPPLQLTLRVTLGEESCLSSVFTGKVGCCEASL